MRTQPRVAVVVVCRVVELAALAAVLFVAGCATKSSGPTTPSLSAAVSGLGSIRPSEVGAAYTITVSNAAGAAPTTGAITVTDPPTNFTVTAIAGTGWTCTFATLTCTRSDVLAAGSSFPVIMVTGNVTGAAGQTVSVPIGISGGGLTTSENSMGSVSIVLPPTITSASSTTFTAGTAGTFTVAASGSPAPTFSEVGALPAGVTLNSTTGVLGGTPGATTGGIYTFTITAQNGVTPNATQSFSLTVDQAPAITSQNSTNFVVGTPGTFTAVATGFPAPTFSETGALPTGVTLNATTGALSGTPATGTQGSYPITITAQNGIGTAATQSFTLGIDLAPAITSGISTTFTTGTAGTFTVVAAGFPAPTFSETGALPSGVILNSTTGALAGTPGVSTGGTYPITITATNGVGTAATQNFTLTVDQAPAITSANATTFTLGFAGTFTVAATGFPAPAFSETGPLPSGVTLNSTTGVLSGTPGAGTQGSYPISITAQNGIGANATQSFTLAVDLAPAITSGNSTTFTVGTPGTFTATATGFPAPTFIETGSLPTGVALNATTGVLSGTPGAGTGGVYSIMLTAQNGATPNATQSFTLTVDQAPSITSQNSATFTAGTAGAFTAAATGFPAPTFSVTTGTLPGGVTLNSTTGVLAGTPAGGTGGTYPVTITAQNGTAPNATQSFTLTVDQAPSITSQNNTTFTAGTAGTFTATATGFPAPTFSLTSGTLPSGVMLNSTTGALAGTPAAGTGGIHPITVTAQNGTAPDATQSFTLTVDEAPAITSANNTTFAVGSTSAFAVTATGFPAPTFSEAGSLPSGVTLNSTTGALSGTPASGTDSQSPYNITITAANGVGTPSMQTFTLTVNLIAPPVFTSANNTTFITGAPGTFTVTASGGPAPMFSLTGGSLPSGVTLNSTTGVLAGTPASGTGAAYVITLTAQNGQSPNATQTFTLTVDQPPVITSGTSTTFTAGSAGTFTVTATGFPAPTFSVTTGTLPGGVTLNSTTGALAGTPAGGTGGTYPVTITAQNGTAPNATQGFTLTVDQAPSITSQNNTMFTAGTPGTFTATAMGFPAPTFSVTSGTPPSGVTLTSGGVLSGTAAAGTGGTDNLTITASNGVGTAATQSFTLTVNEAPSITSQNNTTFTTATLGTFTATATGFPAPTFSVTSGTLPSGVALSPTGVLSGTPGSGTQGTYPITITAANGVGTPGAQSFTLTVSAGPPTVTLSLSSVPPLQVGQASRTMTITVANDLTGDTPTLSSFTLAGVACTLSTCGSFGGITGTPGSGSYSVLYTPPPTGLTAAISPTVTVSPSVTLSGQSFPGTLSFTVSPSGLLVVSGAGLNIIQPGTAAKTLTYIVYNDVNNAGVALTLTGAGYSCQNLSTNSCGSLQVTGVTLSGTTTTTTVQYTPPASVPAAPYNRPAIQATSLADPTKLFHQNFLLSTTTLTAPLAIPYGQKFDSALTGASSLTVAAGFTDASAVKSAAWTITAGSVSCQVTPNSAPCVTVSGTLAAPTVTSNGNSVSSVLVYTPPAAVPTGNGQSSPTITAAMTANGAAMDSFSFNIVNGACVTGTGNNSVLNGSYAFLTRGGGATAGYVTTIGSFTADGNGNIIGGIEDTNRSLGTLVNSSVTGSYSVGSDNRGCVALTVTNGTTTATTNFRIALGAVSGGIATQGTIANFSDVNGQGLRANGVLKLQDLTTVTSATVGGPYAFGEEGMDSSGQRFANAGVLTSNGAGTLSSIVSDFDDGGFTGTNSGGTGSYTLATGAPGGRGTIQATTSGVTSNSVVYVVSASDLYIMSTDPADENHPIWSGEAKLQVGPFTTTGLNGGGYVLYGSGIDNSNGGSDAVIGQSQFTTNGNATVTIDENDNGISQPEGIGPATFTVASTGRMTGTGLGGHPPVFYMVDSTQGFLVGSDDSVVSGYIQEQTLSSFSTSTISGQFFFVGEAPTIGGSIDTGAVTFTPGTPSGTLAGTDDGAEPNFTLGCTQNCGGGLQPNNPISGNGGSNAAYEFQAVSGVFTPTAPGQGNLGGGSIAYIISPSKVVFIQTGTAQSPNPAEVFIVQSNAANQVAVVPPVIDKVFGAATLLVSETTSLTFTIDNLNSSHSLSGIGFSDPLPSGLKVSTPNGLSGACGGGTITAAAGSTSVTLSGAALAAGTGCTFGVNVTGVAAGLQSNVTSNVTSIEGGAGNVAQASITVSTTNTMISSLTVNPTSTLGGNAMTGTVALSAAAPAGGVVVTLSSGNTSIATVPSTVTVAAGASIANFTVATLPLTAFAPVQTTISGSFNGSQQQAAVWVTPPFSLVSARLASSSVIGTTSTSLTVTLTSAAPAGGPGIPVSVNSSNTSVAFLSSGTLTIPAGSNSMSVLVNTNPVASATQATINVSLNGQTLGTTLTVNPGGSLVVSNLTFNFGTVVGGSSVPLGGPTGTVTLSSAPAVATQVALSSSNTAATPPTTVTVGAGVTTAQFQVATTAVTASGTQAVISATLNGQTMSTPLTLNLPLAVATTTLPLGEVGATYIVGSSAKLALTGGGTGAFTWSLLNGTTLPAPLTLSAAGVIAGTPAAPTTTPTPTFTVQVRDNQGNTAQATLSIRVDPVPSTSVSSCGPLLGNESILNGHYAFVGQGYVGASFTATTPIVFDGSFNALGTGAIGSGGVDYINSYTSSGAQPYTVTGGFFTLGSDNQGCVQLNLLNGATTSTVIFHIAMGGVLNGSNIATHGNLIEFDNYTGDLAGSGTDATGELRLQDTSDFLLSSLNTRYAYGSDGADIAGGHFATAGSFTLNTSTGAISNLAFDLDDAGTIASNITGETGSAGAIDGNGTLLSTFNLPVSLGGGTATNRIVIVNKNEFFVIGAGALSSTTAIYSGRTIATASSYTANSVANTYIFHTTGIDNGDNGLVDCTSAAPCTDVDVGLVTFNPSTLQLSGTTYEQEGGFTNLNTITSTSYAVDASAGRVVITSSQGGNPVLYIATPVSSGIDLTDPIYLFLVGSGTGQNVDSSGTFGVGEIQPNPGTYGNSSLSSTPIYLVGTADMGQPAINNYVGTASFSTGIETGTYDTSGTGGLFIDAPIVRGFFINLDGTGTGANGSVSLEVTNGTDLYFIIPNATTDSVRAQTQ